MAGLADLPSKSDSSGFALMSPGGHFVAVNPVLCAMLGYSVTELLHYNFQSLTHPDDLLPTLGGITELLESRATQFSMRKRFIHKHGYPVELLLDFMALWKEGNRPAFFIARFER